MHRLVFAFMALALFSCSKPNTYTKEVSQLDSLHAEVVKAEDMFKGLPHAEMNSRLDSIQSTVNYVKEASGGEINRENGLLLDKYRNTKNIVKKFKKRAPQIRAEIERTKNQLMNFKSALSSGATHDKNETEMDEEYVQTNMKKEKEAAETLVQTITELNERSSRFITEHDKRLEELKPYLNTLQ